MPYQDSNNLDIIGIDVAKSKLDIYISTTGSHQTIDNSEKGIKQFIRALDKQQTRPTLVMENTGGYEVTAHRLFSKAGYLVHIAHSTRVHYFAKQKGYFAKTDKLDAKTIAEYAIQEQVEVTELPSAIQATLKALSNRKTQLTNQLTTEKCRVKPHLAREIIQSINRTVKYLQKEIAVITAKINKLIASEPSLSEKQKRMQTLKGIGETTSAYLISLLPELGLLNRNKIACLVGLAPKNHDSGSKTGQRMIVGGRFSVRKALYMAALSAIRFNPIMKAYYQHLKNKGKHSKVAITAVMRKMLITLNAMIRDNKDWTCV